MLRRALLFVGGGVGMLLSFVALLVVGTFAAAGSLVRSGANDGQLARGGAAGHAVPKQYRGLIEKWGNLCDALSPALLAAQLYQESGFRATASSSANAQGIAQFLPETWAVHGIDANKDGKKDLWDPEDAIPSAASYDCSIAKNVKAAPGDAANNMLAGYNAGPYRVISAGGVPKIHETQQYVHRIRSLAKSFAAPKQRAQPVGYSAKAAGALYYANDRLGTPYLWGGEGRADQGGRFDCSGLTQAAFRSVGISLPRVADQQWYSGPHPSRSQLRPGDLVFFGHDLNNPHSIHHVGIYAGNGYMINAPRTGAVIRYEKVDNQPGYFGATRVTSAGAKALPKRNDDGKVVRPKGPAR